MQTLDKSGIICDRCSMTSSSDFTYYSFDFRKVVRYGGPKPSIATILLDQIIGSCDICTNCFAKISSVIVENNKSKRNNICEISGKALPDDYFYCVVARAHVLRSNVTTDQRYVEFCLNNEEYLSFVSKKPAGEWSTES